MSKFLKLLALMLVCSALAFGQASTTPSVDTTVTASLLPSNFAAAGAMYTPSTSSKYTGWVTYAHLLDQKSGTYFFSTEDVIPVINTKPYTIQTSARVGFGTLLKQFGQVRVWGIVDGGGASTGTQSGGAAGGRTCVTAPIKKVYSVLGCYGIIKSNIVDGTPKVIEFGFGKSW